MFSFNNDPDQTMCTTLTVTLFILYYIIWKQWQKQWKWQQIRKFLEIYFETKATRNSRKFFSHHNYENFFYQFKTQKVLGACQRIHFMRSRCFFFCFARSATPTAFRYIISLFFHMCRIRLFLFVLVSTCTYTSLKQLAKCSVQIQIYNKMVHKPIYAIYMWLLLRSFDYFDVTYHNGS